MGVFRVRAREGHEIACYTDLELIDELYRSDKWEDGDTITFEKEGVCRRK